MKVTLDVHAIDWESKSTYALDNVVFEGTQESILYNLAGFLVNGEGEFQIVVKKMTIV